MISFNSATFLKERRYNMAKETKIHILRQFSKLLSDNDLDKITVTMLVEKCNISRQTFYYHFSDIQALINWGVQQYTHGRVESAKHAKDIKEATVIYLQGIENNRLFLQKCFESSLCAHMTILIRNSIMEYSAEFYRRSPLANAGDSDIADFIIEFTANGVTGFIVSLLFFKSKYTVEELADIMYESILKKLPGKAYMQLEDAAERGAAQ